MSELGQVYAAANTNFNVITVEFRDCTTIHTTGYLSGSSCVVRETMVILINL
jgi:hypothetical protein